MERRAKPIAPPPAAGHRRRRRSDADRSAASILDAASRVLGANPGASVEEIARAAGLTRQTVYAHYGSRDALLQALLARAATELMPLVADARLDEGPPVEALGRLFELNAHVAKRYPYLFGLPAVSAEEDRERHAPVVDPVERLIRRGQAAGDFDASVPPQWLMAAMLALGAAADAEVRAGRMGPLEATAVVRRGVLRVFGVRDPFTT